MSAEAPAFELTSVTVERAGATVLEDVNLRVERGDYLAILGPNGSGKTTLLRTLVGLHTPSSGNVRVLGGTPEAARGRVGYVPQRAAFDLDFPIQAGEVVRMGRLAGKRWFRNYNEADRAASQLALERVDAGHLAQRAIGELSGGELQRVLIARALAAEPEIILLDEPTASLDERIGRGVWEILEELSQRMTIVLVSHDIGAISHYVRSVACLNRHLHMHPGGELDDAILEAAYGGPVDLVAHGHPRVLAPHPEPDAGSSGDAS
jgi:zinc transport system ATP-binding protein